MTEERERKKSIVEILDGSNAGNIFPDKMDDFFQYLISPPKKPVKHQKDPSS
ncbi:MAG: hypothetical protein Q8P11_01215 [bacterium]|nr:hypothetical protein [bacterium]